ncbi:MAG: sodium:proton antiporter [Candidatus Dojkabacteria bacterium]|nr:sodium:proton antiporter [Candidatus Dojkabacteria bacterium]
MEDQSHIFLNVVLGVCLVLFFASTLYVFSKKFNKIPYTVLLLVFGLILSLFEIEILNSIKLTPGAVMYIYLPILLFESAFNFDFAEFKKIIAPATLLATFGLLLSGVIIALPLHFIFNIDLTAALLFGFVISSTDPIAVLTIFKNLGVPKKLQLLVDAESFLNDATSVIAFKILSSVILAATATFSIFDSAVSFVQLALGGVIIGTIFGYIFSWLIAPIKNVAAVEIVLTLIVAHLSFIVAEDLFGASGIISVLFTGLVLGNYGRRKISPQVTKSMHDTWELVTFITISLVFTLIGYEINLLRLINSWQFVAVFLAVMLIARSLSVYLIGGIYNLFADMSSKIPVSWLHITNWGGLRGALPMIVILSLPTDYEYRSLFLELTLAGILFTLLVNSLTIESIIKFFKINALDLHNKLEICLAQSKMLSDVYDKIKEFGKIGLIEDKHIQNFDKKIKEKIHSISNDMQNLLANSFQDDNERDQKLYVVLQKYCLNVEKAVYTEMFENQKITEVVYNTLIGSINRQISKLDHGENLVDKVRKKDEFLASIGSNNLELSFWDRFLFVLGFLKGYEKMKQMCIYAYHKARILGDIYVLEELNGIKEMNIYPVSVINRVIEFYLFLLERNTDTIKKFEKNNPSCAADVDNLILEHETERVLEHDLEEYKEKQILSSRAVSNIKV